MDLIGRGRRIVEKEAEALSALAGSIGESFERAVRRLEACEGRIIVTGVGKAGNCSEIGNILKVASAASSEHWTLGDRLDGRVGQLLQQLRRHQRRVGAQSAENEHARNDQEVVKRVGQAAAFVMPPRCVREIVGIVRHDAPSQRRTVESFQQVVDRTWNQLVSLWAIQFGDGSKRDSGS